MNWGGGLIRRMIMRPAQPPAGRILVRVHSHSTCTSIASTTTEDGSLAQATRHWFHTIVLGQKLCPFAAPLVVRRDEDDDRNNNHNPTLRIVASSATTADQAVADVQTEVTFLMQRPSPTKEETERTTTTSSTTHPTTTLIVFDNVPLVRTFVDFVRLSWTLQQACIVDQNLTNELQLVLFHPQALHNTYNLADDDDEDAGNYTIRSPYPTVHLLREVDVLQAVQSGYPNLQDLPQRNKAKLRTQGIQVCQTRLRECYPSD